MSLVRRESSPFAGLELLGEKASEVLIFCQKREQPVCGIGTLHDARDGSVPEFVRRESSPFAGLELLLSSLRNIGRQVD